MADASQLVFDMIKERSCMKRNVYENTIQQFNSLKAVLAQYTAELAEKIDSVDKRLEIKYEDKSDFECRLTIAGDTLIFYMHSNVFQFDQSHHIWKTSYVKEDEMRSYCGIIHVYNFLADSFRMSRMNDIGYMIARVFVNKEDHFLVEGRRQLGYLFNDYVNDELDEETWKNILESSLLYSLDFNLYVPPYNEVNTTTVLEVNEVTSGNSHRTGKRFGFQFSSSEDNEFLG
jgi:hypothetical protein